MKDLSIGAKLAWQIAAYETAESGYRYIEADKEEPHSYLEHYGRDLTRDAKEGKLGPFVGRRNELLQVIQTLARAMKNNPVLIGKAGVGKTAIVEALAVRAAQGKDPQVLSGKKIKAVDLVDKAGARVQVPFLSMVQSIKPDDAKAGEASDAGAVTEHTIAEVLSDKTGIPLEIIKGHLEEEGQLTGKLRSKPYSIVLLDEAEKAHPKVFDLFLQLFDEGRLTDAKGRTIDARNAIFIMTSNLLQSEHQKGKIGFLEQRNATPDSKPDSEVLKYFRPELLNRINEKIIFQPLNDDSVKMILKNILDRISLDMKERYNISLKFSEEAELFLSQKGFSLQYGVRELRRTVEQFVQIPLSNLILTGKLKGHNSWQAVCIDDRISIIPHELKI